MILLSDSFWDASTTGAEDFRIAPNATRLRYSYPALPEGLVARAIVRLHEFIEEVNGKSNNGRAVRS